MYPFSPRISCINPVLKVIISSYKFTIEGSDHYWTRKLLVPTKKVRKSVPVVPKVFTLFIYKDLRALHLHPFSSLYTLKSFFTSLIWPISRRWFLKGEKGGLWFDYFFSSYSEYCILYIPAPLEFCLFVSTLWN